MANIDGLSLTEDTTEYNFTIAPNPEGGEFLAVKTRSWEQGDPTLPWRYPVHNFLHAGLRSDRLTQAKGYAKGNCDVSNPGLIVPPPLLSTVTAPTTYLAAVGVRASASAFTSAATSLTISKPTGTVDTDVMFAWISISTDETITAPAGWTLIRTTSYDTASSRAGLYWKLAASEGANYQWTTTGSPNWAGGIITLTGVHATTPYDVENSQTTVSGVNHATPSVTPTVYSDSGAVLAFFALAQVSGNTWTPPSGMTESVDATSNTGGGASESSIEIAYLLSTIVTGTGIDKTATSTATALGAAQIVIVKPRTDSLTITASYDRCVLYNSKAYFASSTGRYLIEVSDTPTATVKKDFGSGAVISFLKVFNNELIIGLGPSNYIWSLNTSNVFTQSTDTIGIAAGVADNKFWIAASTNQLKSATTGPLTLSNYAPADPNEYLVGDTTWYITDMLEYGGVIHAAKGNGIYAPDAISDFHNQAPQMAMVPSTYNKWPFVAKNYLWSPTISGLLRISPGESRFKGPEKSGRPDYRFRIYHGCEWQESIYLVGHSLAGSDQAAVFRMDDNEQGIADHEYIYTEHVRLGSTTAPECIMVLPSETMPLMFIGHGTAIKYFELGRGGGRYIDDPNYPYGLSWELESGDFVPNPDVGMAVKSLFVGVKVLLDHDSSESLTLSYDANHTGSYTSLLDTQEGGGSAAITATSGYAAVTRYAAANVTCQQLGIKLAGTLSDAHSGTDRPEVREIWAFGYSIPDQTHLIEVGVIADPGAHTFGLRQGDSEDEIFRLFSDWAHRGVILTCQLPNYESSRTIRVKVMNPDKITINAKDRATNSQSRVSVVTATLLRVDYAGAIFDA